MKKREKGAIIIEGTLILPFFMFAIITVLSIVNICFAQAKIGTALNETAKEISQYSYLYGLTGLDKKQAQLYSEGAEARAHVDQIAGGVSELFSSASSIGNTVSSSYSDPSKYGDAYNSISGSIETGKGSISSISEASKALASDPTGIMKMFANEGLEKAKSFITSQMVPVFMEKHLLRKSTDNSAAFLSYLGVVPDKGSALPGLDFGDSVLFTNGSNEIKLIVKYDIQVWRLLGIDVKLSFVQCAVTKAWFEGGGASAVSGTSDVADDSGNGSSSDNNISGNDGIVSGGTSSETEEDASKESSKSAAQYAKESTHNSSSNMVILGKYNNSYRGQSYIDTAIEYEATYFNMTDYDEVATEKGNDFMWSINEAFLKEQSSKGKTFYLTDDPDTAAGTYAKEVKWLKDNGYKFEYSEVTGFWKAVK